MKTITTLALLLLSVPAFAAITTPTSDTQGTSVTVVWDAVPNIQRYWMHVIDDGVKVDDIGPLHVTSQIVQLPADGSTMTIKVYACVTGKCKKPDTVTFVSRLASGFIDPIKTTTDLHKNIVKGTIYSVVQQTCTYNAVAGAQYAGCSAHCPTDHVLTSINADAAAGGPGNWKTVSVTAVPIVGYSHGSIDHSAHATINILPHEMGHVLSTGRIEVQSYAFCAG